jgi:GTP-binding protein YchF
LDIAIVGPAQSGKTSVFTALALGHAQKGDDRREHVATVKIPDERLDQLAALIGSNKVTPVEVRLHDLPALFEKGRAASGEASESLARADGLILVARAFRRPDVPHARGDVDAARDIEELLADMLLHDLDIVERRLEKLDTTVRSAKPGEREAAQREQELLQRTRDRLSKDSPLRDDTPAEDAKGLSNYGLLTLKPLLVVINLDEADAGRAAEVEAEFQERFGQTPARLGGAPKTCVGSMCARLEAELGELEPEEAAAFRRELGTGEPAAPRLLAQAREMLGMITFFTAGENEARAWALPAGATALQAAGRVHTDMERGFIRAETIGWHELLEFGSEAEAKKHGRLRSEGKGYVVQDGDVLHVLFSV